MVHARRKRQKVNYAQIENEYDDIEEEESEALKDHDLDQQDDQGHDNQSEYDNDVYDVKEVPRNGSSRRKSTKIKDEEDDESFNEDASEDDIAEPDDDDDDAFSSDYDRRERARADKNFVSRDPDDVEDDDEEYGANRKRRRTTRNKSRGRRSVRARHQASRSRRNIQETDEDEEEDLPVSGAEESTNKLNSDDTLQQELADLKEDSSRSPVSRSLRQRKKEVNYTIPPPLTDNLEVLEQPSTPRRRGAPNGPIRRLFPTGGPFGGGDVTSIFGKNYTGLTGAAQSGGLLGAGGADSDSSEDEIIPVGGASNKRNSISTPMGMGNTGNKKNKSAPADSDPLGVDMNIDFSSVGGLENYINQLKEMVALPLLYPEVYQKFGITPPRGVLFHGPPGTGKTLMARALAASCSTGSQKITFFMRKGADCLSKWVGEAERQLRLLFEEARKQQPSIIFFDEIDGLAPVRSSKQEQIHASIVSTLLALMDGMDNRGQVIVIGATNRPDAVDPALRRPGRFDREFYFPLPDLKARRDILTIHTKKWEPKLPDEFIENIAHLTKGYGGADLRALCTEAALNSIQRRYPQIYASEDKLKIDPDSIQVAAKDFIKALEKIVPSSARSTSNGSAPLPDHLISLLQPSLDKITAKLDKLVPKAKKVSVLEEAQYTDASEQDPDGGFAKHQMMKRLESSRVHRPRLLITGEAGNGQQYLGSAVLNHLEGYNVHSLDLGALFSDSTRTIENAITQSFIEARRQKPSIIFIPNVDTWFETIPDSAKSTLSSSLRGVSSNERILVLGISETPIGQLPYELRHLFGVTDANFVSLSNPKRDDRAQFFQLLWNALMMKPTEFLDNKKKRKLAKLEKAEIVSKPEDTVEDLKAFEKPDMKLKNTLKIKLSGLMDLFKTRYKKFRKPPIDDYLLVHLFEPVGPEFPPSVYSKEGNMIVENSTGRRFHNMDLDIIEERLWNGFYSEPKQFLKDIEMIYHDSVSLNDRERLIKASEMYANAQVGVEEISTPEFVEQCKQLRRRELLRIKKHDEETAKLQKVLEKEADVSMNGEPNGNSYGDGHMETITESRDEDGDVVVEAPSMSVTNEPVGTNGLAIGELVHAPEPEFQKEVEEPLVATEVVQALDKPDEDPKSITEEVNSPKDTAVEADEEEPEEPEPPLLLDESKLKTAQDSLVEESDDLTVENLELINAKLMEIIWEERHNWDRNGILEKMILEISKIHHEFKANNSHKMVDFS